MCWCEVRWSRLKCFWRMERLRLASVHLTNHMSVEHDWNKWGTRVQSSVKQHDSVYYQGESRDQWPPCCEIAFSANLCHLSELRSEVMSYHLKQIRKSVEAFQAAASGWHFPVQKGPQELSLKQQHICFRCGNVVFTWACPWWLFSCWFQISLFFRSIGIMAVIAFCEQYSKGCMFLRGSVFWELVRYTLDIKCVLLKYSMYISYNYSMNKFIAFSSFWYEKN